MKKILLVALALCLSYGFAYSCLFNHSINLTTKMQNFETDSFTTKNGKSLKITFFKHASLLIEYAGKKFFIDPVSDYADFTQQPKADYILITHEHHDHFDTKAIAAIETPDTKIIANPNCQKMLDKGQAMKNGDILQIKQIKNIDIAFLPVNQPYTMIPEQAIQSAKIIQPHILYPYHYGDTNINEVKDGLKNEKEIEVRIRALQ